MLRKVFFAEILFIWLAFSSIIIAQLFVIFGTSINFLFLKDLVIIIILVISLLLSSKKVITPLLCVLPVIFYALISALFSEANLFAKLASLRQMFMPFMLIFIGYLAINSKDDFRNLIRIIISTLKFLLVLGFAELFFNAWEYIDIRSYYQIKSMWVNPQGYPSTFIEPIFGGIKRMASVFLDPINLGHAFVFLFYLLYTQKGSRYWIILTLIGIALTISKGAILQLFIVFWIINKNQNVFNKAIMITGIFLIMFFAYFYHSGLEVHVSGFSNSLKSISVFGKGLAMVGNQSHMFATEITDQTGIGDTFIGSILGQLGLVGFIFWLFPFLYFSNFFSSNSIFTRLLAAQLIVSILSENAFNLLSIVSLTLTFGGALYINYNNKNKTL